jgi:Ca2+-transporting ATPase
MLQRLLDTTSLTGRQWVVVLALSLLAPATVAIDKGIQIWRTRHSADRSPSPSRHRSTATISAE